MYMMNRMTNDLCIFFLVARWKAGALTDGSGLSRQDLERVNSLMDMRIKNLSQQLARLEESHNVRVRISGGGVFCCSFFFFFRR